MKIVKRYAIGSFIERKIQNMTNQKKRIRALS
jgi:hypothetical protein